MRILLTGATGVIGRRAVPLLLADGHEVTAAVREAGRGAGLGRLGATCIPVDLLDPGGLKRALDGHEAIINLATHMPQSAWRMLWRSAWRMNDRVRREGAANVAAAARAAGVRLLLQESFALAYPDGGDRWIDEHTALAPAAYNATVLDAERAAAAFAGDGRRALVLRFAAFYGPDALQTRAYLANVRRGWAALPGGPDRFVSSISHDDAASAVVAALAAPSGAYNVTDDEPVRLAAFSEAIARAIGARTPRPIPAWLTPLLGSVAKAMSRSLRLSNRKLKEATGWTPRYPSVREGWPATIAEMTP